MNSSLEKQLVQYETASRGQLSAPGSLSSWAGYAAAASATLAMTATAEAGVLFTIETNSVTWGVPNATYTNQVGTDALDVDGVLGANQLNAGDDFALRATYGVGPTAVSSWISYYGTGVPVPSSYFGQAGIEVLAADARLALDSSGYVRRFDPFAAVTWSDFDNAAEFGDIAPIATGIYDAVGTGTETGDWAAGEIAYAAFMIGPWNTNGFPPANQDVVVGWLQLGWDAPSLTTYASGVVVRNYPTEPSTTDVAIKIPAAHPLALLAAGAFGIAAFRRKRAN